MTSTRSNINIANKYDRVVVLVDMDCFYCQVEEKLNPQLIGKPIAVVQYNTWQGGGIIAVNYPARAQGVTRHMRGNQAKDQCPEIELVSVPNVREKADLTKYREAGKDVANVLQTFTTLLERASVDEAYLDITEQVSKRIASMNDGSYKISPTDLHNTYAVGYENIGLFINEISSKFGKEYEIDDELEDFECDETDLPAVRKSNLKLLIGATITSEIRAKVKEKTGYECSAGIAHNKILAKLACGINKPNKQTLLPLKRIPQLFRNLPIGKIKGLGGKFGEEVCETLKVQNLGDLIQFEENILQRKFDEKSGAWLYLIARGIDLETVTPRFYSKSIGCCKKFPGRNAITGLNTLNHWLNELGTEIAERLEKDLIENNRKAKQMIVSYIQDIKNEEISSSRTTILPSYEPEHLAKNALEILKKNTEVFLKPNNDNILNNPIKFLGISVGKFEPIQAQQNTLKEMFLQQDRQSKEKKTTDDNCEETVEKKNIKMITNIESKTNKKSFFLEHFKKQGVNETIPQINTTELSNTNDITINLETEKKSFFLQTIKQKKKTDDILDNPDNMEIENNQSKEIVETTNNKNIKSFFCNKNSKLTNPVCATATASKSESTTENILLDDFIEDIKNMESEVVNERQEINENRNLPDYTSTYAEFNQPEFKDEDFIKCLECKQNILSYNLQTHLDGHLAFKLSQQQREEYRNEIKEQIAQNIQPLQHQQPPNKKFKSNTSTSILLNNTNNNSVKLDTTKKPLPNIMKFLKKYEKNQTPKNMNEVSCPECGHLIDHLKLREHQDHHLAQKIQNDWNHENNNQILTDDK